MIPWFLQEHLSRSGLTRGHLRRPSLPSSFSSRAPPPTRQVPPLPSWICPLSGPRLLCSRPGREQRARAQVTSAGAAWKVSGRAGARHPNCDIHSRPALWPFRRSAARGHLGLNAARAPALAWGPGPARGVMHMRPGDSSSSWRTLGAGRRDGAAAAAPGGGRQGRAERMEQRGPGAAAARAGPGGEGERTGRRAGCRRRGRPGAAVREAAGAAIPGPGAASPRRARRG